jgi:hypothetical protein
MYVRSRRHLYPFSPVQISGVALPFLIINAAPLRARGLTTTLTT